jgi:hypothetical protein
MENYNIFNRTELNNGISLSAEQLLPSERLHSMELIS